MTQTPSPDGRWFCERCTSRYDTAGDCPKCPEEPLLDLLDEDVLLLLRSFDDPRWRKRAGLLTGLAALVCAPLWLIAAFSVRLALIGWGFATMGLSGALFFLFSPKKRTPDMGQNH